MGQKASKKQSKAAVAANSGSEAVSNADAVDASSVQSIMAPAAPAAVRKSKKGDSKRSSGSNKKHRHGKKGGAAAVADAAAPTDKQISVQQSSAWSEEKVEKLFDEYEQLNNKNVDDSDELAVDPADDEQRSGDDDEGDAIGPNGIAALFNACGIDAESDEITLVFAQQCGATRLGFFSKEEFLNGMRALNCSSTAELKSALAGLRRKFDATGPDRALMSFVFDLGRTGPDVKTIDPLLASGLAALLLRRTALGARLATFLSEQTAYRGINADQWLGVWEFARSVDAEFSGYDEDGAWPIIIDDFVNWCKKE